MLDLNQLRDYCLEQKETVEEFPFGPDVRVFKVMGKMFALVPVNGEATISLKCDPTWAKLLRDTYPAVQPGYHLNKQHWNTVISDGSIPDDEIKEMIRHSYRLIVKGLTKAQRAELEKSGD